MKTEIRAKESKEEMEYKLILLGDTSVGKTCLFKKITSGSFIDKNVSTVGIDRRTIKVQCKFEEEEKDNNNIIITLTDTAGQERFKAITKSYYKGSDAAILIYDITERKTFEHLKEWIESIRNSASAMNNENYCIFLMGMKSDLIESGKRQRKVELEEALNKCKEFNLEWGGECSNKEFSEEKYIEIFKGFIQIIYKKAGPKKFRKQSIVKLEPNKKKKHNRNCLDC
jgi:small GTP-binding protein